MPVKGVVSEADYTFNKTAKAITFSPTYAGLALSDIMYIINVMQGVATVIYDPADAAKGGTLNGLTLTLAYDTSAMNDTDSLQIIVGRVETVAAIDVQEKSRFEGKSVTELLGLMLTELQMLNQYIAELPTVLQGKTPAVNQPADFRNEQSIFI